MGEVIWQASSDSPLSKELAGNVVWMVSILGLLVLSFEFEFRWGQLVVFYSFTKLMIAWLQI